MARWTSGPIAISATNGVASIVIGSGASAVTTSVPLSKAVRVGHAVGTNDVNGYRVNGGHDNGDKYVTGRALTYDSASGGFIN